MIIYSHQNVFNDWINYFVIADKIIALTEATKNDLPKFFRTKITVIPHGIIISKQTEQKKLNKKTTTFGYVGRFVEWKGVLELIDEFIRFNGKYKNTQLILIGEGEISTMINRKISAFHFNEKIKIIPPQIDLEPFYQKIDVLILPSKKIEGFGIVLVEAMAHGIPVIVFDIPTFKKTVVDSYNGIIVKVNLFDAMEKIIDSESLYLNLCKNALMFSQKYGIEKIIIRYLDEIYQ